jgi:short-subunit dehydrogenase
MSKHTLSRVVIAGATSAMAREAARSLARKGAELFLVARDRAKLDAVAADLKVQGAKSVHTAVADLASTSAHEQWWPEALAALGEPDAVLIAHGILGDADRARHDAAHTTDILTTNFLSVAAMLAPISTWFEQRGRGVIAVIGSVAGDRGRQSNYVYGASKGGLDIFLQGLRNRLFLAGVDVVTIKPGFVDTPMTAHLPKTALFASAQAVGAGIVQAMERGDDIVYLPFFWRYILLVFKLLPESVFKRLKT